MLYPGSVVPLAMFSSNLSNLDNLFAHWNSLKGEISYPKLDKLPKEVLKDVLHLLFSLLGDLRRKRFSLAEDFTKISISSINIS